MHKASFIPGAILAASLTASASITVTDGLPAGAFINPGYVAWVPQLAHPLC